MNGLQAPPAWEQSAARRAAQGYAAHENTQILSVDHEGEGVQRSERAWSLEEPDEEGGQGPSTAMAWHTHAADEHMGAERQGSGMLSMLGAAQPFKETSRPSTGSAWAGQDISRQGTSGAHSVADLRGALSQGGRMPVNGDPEHAQDGSRPSSGGSQGAGLLAQGALDNHSSAGQLSAGADVPGLPGSGHFLDEVHLPAGLPVTGVAGMAIQPETEGAATGVQPVSRGSDKGSHEVLIHDADQLPYGKAHVSGWAGDQERHSENILPVQDSVGAHGQWVIDRLTGDGPALGSLGTLKGPASSLQTESGHASSLLQAQHLAQAQHAADLRHVRSRKGTASGQDASAARPASSGATSTGTKQPQAVLLSADQVEEPAQASTMGHSAAPVQGMQRAAQRAHGSAAGAAQAPAQQAGIPGGLSAADCVFSGNLGSRSCLRGAAQHSAELQILQACAASGSSAAAQMPFGRQETAACSSEARAVPAAVQVLGTATTCASVGGDELAVSHKSEGSANSAESEIEHAAKEGASGIRDELATSTCLKAQAISAALPGLGVASAESASAGNHKLVPYSACEEVAASHRVESQVSAVLSSVASFLGSAAEGSQASSPSSCPAMRHLSELESQLRSSQGSAQGVCSDAAAFDVPPPQHQDSQRDSQLRSSQGSAQGHDSNGASLGMRSHASHGDLPSHRAGAGESTAASAVEHKEQSLLSGTGLHVAGAGSAWHELAAHSACDGPARTVWREAAVHGADAEPAESAWHEAVMHGAAAGAGRQIAGPVSVLHDQPAPAAAAASSTASAGPHAQSTQQQSLTKHAGELKDASRAANEHTVTKLSSTALCRPGDCNVSFSAVHSDAHSAGMVGNAGVAF